MADQARFRTTAAIVATDTSTASASDLASVSHEQSVASACLLQSTIQVFKLFSCCCSVEITARFRCRVLGCSFLLSFLVAGCVTNWKIALGLSPVCSQALQQLYPSTGVRLYQFSTGTTIAGA